MKIVITITGRDQIGIVAMVATACAEHNVNILDINQNIVNGFFNMVMIADMAASKMPLVGLQEHLKKVGEEIGVEIKVQHEDIFKIMHRV